jgi:hypothetical protein
MQQLNTSQEIPSQMIQMDFISVREWPEKPRDKRGDASDDSILF